MQAKKADQRFALKVRVTMELTRKSGGKNKVESLSFIHE